MNVITEAIPALGLRPPRAWRRLADVRDFHQMIQVVERVCGICSIIHALCYCQGIEEMMGVEVPPRARFLRVIWSELHRIQSHLLWLGLFADSFGFESLFMQFWRIRGTDHGHQRGHHRQPGDRVGQRDRRRAPQSGCRAAALGALPARLGGGGDSSGWKRRCWRTTRSRSAPWARGSSPRRRPTSSGPWARCCAAAGWLRTRARRATPLTASCISSRWWRPTATATPAARSASAKPWPAST